jgi:hypothetical protein
MDSRNPNVSHDTEDRVWWLRYGEKLEDQFVGFMSETLHIAAVRNPAKETDPTAPDLIVEGVLAEVKTQNTPFFTAARHGFEPRFAVSFNRKDYDYYSRCYPELIVYFWVDWKQLEGYGTRIEYFGGIFRLPFPKLKALIDSSEREHHYLHRKHDTQRNAKSSFLVDVRKLEAVFRTENPEGWHRNL